MALFRTLQEKQSLLLLNTEMGFSNLKKRFHRHKKIHMGNSASLGCGVGIDSNYA